MPAVASALEKCDEQMLVAFSFPNFYPRLLTAFPKWAYSGFKHRCSMISKRTRLNLQADKIEMVLAHHKLAAQVFGGSVTPNTVRFDLNVAPNVKLNKLASLAE